jgi:hypothetical protein
MINGTLSEDGLYVVGGIWARLENEFISKFEGESQMVADGFNLHPTIAYKNPDMTIELCFYAESMEIKEIKVHLYQNGVDIATAYLEELTLGMLYYWSITVHQNHVTIEINNNTYEVFEGVFQKPSSVSVSWVQLRGITDVGSGYNVEYYADNLVVYSSSISDPTPDIRINGHDAPPPLDEDDPMDITISLSPNKKLGEVCEIWIYALTQFGTFWLNSSSEWELSNDPISNGQYALSDISAVPIPSFQLPPGVATFNYVIDPIPDGVFDFSWYDYVNVIRKSGGIIVQPDSKDMDDVWITSVYYKGGKDNEYLITGGWGDYYYSLLKFDLTNLPSNVTSAEIQLFCYGVVSPHTMYLDKVTEAWDEKTKWENRPSSVELETLPVPSPDEWYSINITDLYNEWKNGVTDNYGIMLRPNRINHSYNQFWSSDYSNDKSLTPKLVIVP